MTILRPLIDHGITIVASSRGAAILGAVMATCIALVALPSQSTAQGSPLTNTFSIPTLGMSLRYPDGWSVAPKSHSDLDVLINVRANQDTMEATASLAIFAQTRTDHDEAVRELGEITSEVAVPSVFLEIGGWPGLQRRSLERRPQPSKAPWVFADPMVLKVTTAVAAGNLLIRLEGSLPSDASQELIATVEALGRSMSFATVGDPLKVEADLQRLRARPGRSSFTPVPPPASLFSLPGFTTLAPGNGVPGAGLEASEEPGAAQRVFTGSNGELEIAVSSNGQNIVVVGQFGRFRTSNDGGQTFPFFGQVLFGNGDPSAAFGQSGNFYYASIDSAEAGNLCPANSDCTGIARSTTNGQTFAIIANAVVCPRTGTGSCFPDQEHIAADRFNAAPGGDHVYSVWRNFPLPITSAPSVPRIVCSQNSGVNWTGPATATNNEPGDFPRVAVGPDGFVYVVYHIGGNIRINKFSSCENELLQQTGFPRPVTGFTDVTCPAVPGLDRCNDGNILSSPTVAADDLHPNIVYVGFATNTGAGNEDVRVIRSLDGGTTWGSTETVNTAVSGRRFMPWICATHGEVFVSWYDRRFATPCPNPPCAANNDLTDYFGGSARLDGLDNLVRGPEFRITEVSDPQCASGWPVAPRAMTDSDSCSVQPQFAGVCCTTPLNQFSQCPAGAGSGARCDYTGEPVSGCAVAGETCRTGGGAPKYGDYNGNACAVGRFFTAWASATPPPGIVASAAIDIFFASFARGDLSIQMTDSPDPVGVGGELTYRIRVRNLGPSDATGVIVTDTLPANVNFVSASSGCSRSGNIVTCKIGNMSDGEPAVRLIRVRPTAAGGFSNTATVTADEPDPNPDNNTTTTVTTVR